MVVGGEGGATGGGQEDGGEGAEGAEGEDRESDLVFITTKSVKGNKVFHHFLDKWYRFDRSLK